MADVKLRRAAARVMSAKRRQSPRARSYLDDQGDPSNDQISKEKCFGDSDYRIYSVPYDSETHFKVSLALMRLSEGVFCILAVCTLDFVFYESES